LVHYVSKHLAPGLGFIREWKAWKKYSEEGLTVLLSLQSSILLTDAYSPGLIHKYRDRTQSSEGDGRACEGGRKEAGRRDLSWLDYFNNTELQNLPLGLNGFNIQIPGQLTQPAI
jgi:hypothetical protein